MILIRLPDIESFNVKFGLGNIDGNIMATLIQSSDFENEMEIRITIDNSRFSVRGHKSIMDKLTFNEFKNKVQYHLKLEALK